MDKRAAISLLVKFCETSSRIFRSRALRVEVILGAKLFERTRKARCSNSAYVNCDGQVNSPLLTEIRVVTSCFMLAVEVI